MKIRYDVQKALQKFEIETLRKEQIRAIGEKVFSIRRR